MNVPELEQSTLQRYPHISRWLGTWLSQLERMGEGDDYKVIVTELANEERYRERLTALDNDLGIASIICKNFASVLNEKSSLPQKVDDANVTILDKLAEIRAVSGLYCRGFGQIEFVHTPDFAAQLGGKRFLIEVTRLGHAPGKRSDVYEQQGGSLPVGFKLGLMVERGKGQDALSAAIYNAVIHEYAQLKKGRAVDWGIVWISLGRDYFVAGKYEQEGVGLFQRMERTTRGSLDDVICELKKTVSQGLYARIKYVVLSKGFGQDNFFSELQ